MIHTSDFMAVLCSQLQACPAVKKLKDKSSLTLFNVLTPNSIVAIDNEISANPYILSEAMGLLEMASQLSAFYSYDFVATVTKTIIDSRYTPDGNKAACTQEELMQDYFITITEDMRYFLRNNPVYLGVYIYVYLSSVTME